MHFTVPREIEVRFASLKVASFSTSVVKKVHFGGSGSEVATFQYKRSQESTLWQLLKVATFQHKCSIKEVHFGSSGSKVATVQYKCIAKEVHFGTSGSFSVQV